MSGARGRGRPPVTLASLIERRAFNPENHRHLRVLEHDELPEGLSGDLLMLVEAYRRAFNRGDRAHLARSFARAVADGRS